MDEKDIKKEQTAKELDMEELASVSGGAGLKDVYITSTEDISESVKNRA